MTREVEFMHSEAIRAAATLKEVIEERLTPLALTDWLAKSARLTQQIASLIAITSSAEIARE